MSLNHHYQSELTALRQLGKRFAERNPALAPFLAESGRDPDVERLLEGVAFLTGRLRQKLYDGLPELTHSLMPFTCPNYIRPLPAFATLPLLLLLPDLSFTDAYFETVSGLTTSGATTLSDLDKLPPSINIWRTQLVWMGGMGVMVLAVAILPRTGGADSGDAFVVGQGGPGGSTLDLYSTNWRSNTEVEGIDTTRAGTPDASSTRCASTASGTSEPVAISTARARRTPPAASAIT